MADEPVASSTRSWLYHPEFPEHWERAALYSLARWVNGLPFREIQFTPTGQPVIKIAEIKNGISGQTKFTDQLFDESVHVGAGDLLFSWSGQPETSIDVFWWRGPDGWLNQHSFRVTPVDGIDRTFFFYVLRYLKPSFIGIARNKQTTGLGHVTKGDLENIEAAYPCLPEQRAIAHILGTLDDKIDLNRRMNETLEGMARAIFKSWFVDFDPVRARAEGRDPGLPKHLADLFPDSFEESELGEIPKGWEVETLADCEEIVLGGTPSTSVDDYWNGPILWATAKDVTQARGPFLMRTERTITQAGLVHSNAKLLPQGTTVVTARGTVGSYKMLGANMAVNQTSYALLPKPPCGKYFLYFSLGTLKSELRQRSYGTIFDTITTPVLAHLRIVKPSVDVLKAFETRVSSFMDKLRCNLTESETLTTLRDLLLPGLITGDIPLQLPSD